MTMRKVKSAPKKYISDKKVIRNIVQSTLAEIADIVGGTLGPSGRTVSIESDFEGIANKVTKDGVSVFKSLGHRDPYKQLIIEQARDGAARTASEAGDGTTTATILSHSLVDAMYAFCDSNKKYSPQKVAREMTKIIRDRLVPEIKSRSILIDESNLDKLKQVARTSSNGDDDIANAVIQAFELIGFTDSTHITIKERPGPYGFAVSTIEGLPIPMGFEESAGKFHTMFITDQGNQRCVADKPLFLLFDGTLSDMVTVEDFLVRLSKMYISGNTDFKNLIIVAHGFGEIFLNQLALNFLNPDTINVIPLKTPLAPFSDSPTQFLMDLSAFTGAKIFGLKDNINSAKIPEEGGHPGDLGRGMEKFEMYRFRCTVVGEPDSVNVEVRADQIKTQIENAGSEAEKRYLTERLGKLTSGIAKIDVSAGSSGEIKEIFDRVEDAVMATRAALTKGVLPGGSRILIDLAADIIMDENSSSVAKMVVAPAIMAPITKLLENSGHVQNEEKSEVSDVIEHLINNRDQVYNVAEFKFENIDETGVFDSTPAVIESLLNAASIAATLGTLGGIVVHPRDDAFERSEAAADREWMHGVNNPNAGRELVEDRL